LGTAGRWFESSCPDQKQIKKATRDVIESGDSKNKSGAPIDRRT
jgi:hypothetical protein